MSRNILRIKYGFKFQKMLRKCYSRRLQKIAVVATLCIFAFFFQDNVAQWFASDEFFPLLKFTSPYKIRNKTNQNPTTEQIWIIYSTERGPNDEIRYLCSQHRYTVLVLGDSQYKKSWRKTSCIFHDLVDQRKLGFRSSQYLQNENFIPVSQSARKNVGILFAIKEGATVIYDLKYIGDFVEVNIEQNWCLQYSDGEYFNPFVHFAMGTHSPSLSYNLISECNPSVVSLLPRVNYIKSQPVSSTCHYVDQQAPPITVSYSTYLNFVPQSLIYTTKSFWSAIHFKTSENDDAYVNTFWQQRLLKSANQIVALQSSTHAQFIERYFSRSEIAVNAKYILQATNCHQKYSVYQCAITLTQKLIQHQMWNESHLDILKAWIGDLESMKYLFPVLQDAYKHSIITKVNYSPKILPKHSKIFSTFCKSDVELPPNENFYYDDILLLIEFNKPIYGHVGLLHRLYSHSFSNIAYCGDSADKFKNQTKHLDFNLTFVEQRLRDGYEMYRCVTVFMKINYNVMGILMLSDDTLLNTWSLRGLPFDKAWTGQLYRLRQGERHVWHHWRQWNGEKALNKAIHEIIEDQIEVKDHELIAPFNTDYFTFEQRLENLTRISNGVCFGFEDITYYPRALNKDVIYYGDMFAKNGLTHELAIPNMVVGLSEPEDIFLIEGSYLWNEDRPNYPMFFHPDHIFLHPFKWSLETQVESGIKFLCEKYLPFVR